MGAGLRGDTRVLATPCKVPTSGRDFPFAPRRKSGMRMPCRLICCHGRDGEEEVMRRSWEEKNSENSNSHTKNSQRHGSGPLARLAR